MLRNENEELEDDNYFDGPPWRNFDFLSKF